MFTSYKNILSGILLGALIALPVQHVGAGLWSFGKSKNKVLTEKAFTYKPDATNTLVAFDLHDTLFDFDYPGLGQKVGMYSLLGGAALVPAYAAFGISGLWIGAIPLAVVANVVSRVSYSLFKNGRRPVIEHVWDSDPILRTCKPEYIQLANLFTPKMDVFAIVDELKEAGYTVVVASNIGPDAWNDLKKRYPKLLNKFDGIVHPNKKNNWLDKKQPQKYFGMLKTLVYEKGCKQAIFIDDSYKNCENAQQVNDIVAAQFLHASKLRQQLTNRGMFPVKKI